MPVSLYDLSVANYIQVLTAVDNYLDKGLAHCGATGIALHDIVETRLIDDMLPFRFQIRSVVHHSLGAVKGIETGSFSPPGEAPDYDYAALELLVSDALDELSTYTPDAINTFTGRDVIFEYGETRLPFTVENFVMSFSLPNFYFHATTAYDILRMNGVPLGKRDYMGTPRFKR